MRSIELPPSLKGRALEGALAFKAEEELPFPAEESLFVLPDPSKGLFFVTRKEQLPEGPYDAVAAAPLALVHFTRYFSLPDEFLLIYKDDEETTFLEVKDHEPTICHVVKDLAEQKRLCKAHGWDETMPVLLLGQKTEGFPLASSLEPRFGLTAEELHKKALLVGLALLPFALPLERFDFSKKTLSFKRIPIIKPLMISALSFFLLWAAADRFLEEKKRQYVKRWQEPSKAALQGYPFPLKPQVPAVSDFLAWLSKEAPEGISIDMIHYSFLSMPTLKNPKERYLVQVELSFLADNAQTARLFHEKLSSRNSFVLQDAHFVWQSSPSGYRSSFRLKDRTLYELS